MLDIPKFMRALEMAGVDNWTWYGASLEDLSEEDIQDDTLVYQALENGGVDNWEGYDEALQLYEEDTTKKPIEDAPKEETIPEVEPVVEELNVANKTLRDIVGIEEFEKIKDTFWKRTTHPKEFD